MNVIVSALITAAVVLPLSASALGAGERLVDSEKIGDSTINRVSASTVVKSAGEKLHDSLCTTYTSIRRVEVKPLTKLDQEEYPGDYVIKYRTAENAVLSKRMCVWADFFQGKKMVRAVPIWFDVTATADVWVAKRDLRSRDQIDQRDFEVQERDIAAVGAKPVTEWTFAAARLKRPVSAGEMLSLGAVEKLPAVVRGESVRVRVVSGSVEIETSGIAHRDGRLGDEVTIENPASGGRYVARVVEPRFVEVVGGYQ
jgi:flagella basal body P-ring formation protein FlgA